MLVVAWFPRSVREQLRNPPTLEAPNVRGGWVYPQPAPTDVALSRRVAGRWYDLFVLHQVVFPLTAGELEIGPASVSYSVPLSTSFLSRELRREGRSEPSTLRVGPLPPTPGGTTFSGAAGEGITVSLDASTTELRPGDAAVVRVEIRGRGNVALWPEPHLRWPAGLRAYRQDVSVDLAIEEGRIGGSKTYEYFVVADSAGRLLVPGLSYPYFDPVARRYRDATTPSVTFASTGVTEVRAPLRSIAPLMARSPWQRVGDGAAAIPAWIWALVVLLSPPVTLSVRYRERLRVSAQRRKHRSESGSDLMRSDAEFGQVLSDLVPTATTMSGAELAAALRAAGIESSLAVHGTQVRDRLHQALYGPQGATDADELVAEVEAVLHRLRREAVGAAGRVLVVAIAFLFAVAGWQTAAAQSAERLYAAGAVRIAADSFAARAGAEPHVAAHWFNLGNAYQRLDATTHARAAWLRAARLAPRNGRVRGALRQTPSPDPVSDRLTWLSPVTPREVALGAIVLWMLGWVLVAMRARLRIALVALGFAALLGAYAGGVLFRYGAPVSLVVHEDTPLRVAPYGSAALVEQLQARMAVQVERSWGPWRLVSRGERSGWLHETEMVGI
ncbi:MAG: BatD family protein, partial [Gemmatimonadota bacterium]|nr:BatD family protein [Gemmatimonadota bacterium]